MNFIIDNYVTNEDTQAYYFNSSLSSFDYKSRIFDPRKESLYDVFDQHKPDVYVTHGYRISQDLIHYIKNNDINLDILVNVQSMKIDEITNLSSYFFDNNIKSSFFFLNIDQNNLPQVKNRNIINICSAADLNLLHQKPSIEYKLDKAILVNSRDHIKSYEPPYHNISTSDKMKECVDFMLPEIVLAPLYKSYKTVIFRDFDGYIPQAFFDAIILGCKVYFDIDDKNDENNLTNLVTKILKPAQSLNFKDDNKLENFEELKTFVLEKHTNINRTKTLLSNIKGNK